MNGKQTKNTWKYKTEEKSKKLFQYEKDIKKIEEMSFQRKLHARAATLASDIQKAAEELFIKSNDTASQTH